MKKAKKSHAPRKRLPDRNSELLVNQRMLDSMRDELKSEIRSQGKRFDSIDKRFDSVDKKFDSIDKKFESIDKRFESIDKRFDSVDKRFDSLEAKMDSMGDRLSADIRRVSVDVHRVIAIVEEQNNRNKIVLDGYQSLYDRQDRVENRMDELTNFILNFKKLNE